MTATLSNDYVTTALFLSTSYDPTSAVAIIEVTTLIVILLGTLVANLIAMITILRDKILRRNLHNWLILNLIINDLGLTITSMPFSVVSIFDNGYFLVHNDVMCRINGTGAVAFSYGNFATVLAISVDRYLTVVWSTRFPPTKFRTIALIVFCWMVSFFNVMPPFFKLLSDFKYHPDTHHCSPVWEECIYYMMCFIILFAITVPFMVFCYTGVVWTLRQQELQLRSFAKDNLSAAASSKAAVTKSSDNSETEDYSPSANVDAEEPSNSGALAKQENERHDEGLKKMVKMRKTDNNRLMQRKLSTDKRVALTGILLVMTTVMCATPYFIVHSCFIPIDSTHWVGVAAMWLGYVNSLLDPLIYTLLNRRVRARYRTMFSWCPRVNWNPVGDLFASCRCVDGDNANKFTVVPLDSRAKDDETKETVE